MSGAELDLAVVGTVDLCFRHGTQLLGKYGNFRASEGEISKKLVSLASRWKRISLQLQFLKKVWYILGEEHQSLQDQVLEILLGKLQLAVSQISKVQTKYSRTRSNGLSRLKRMKLASVVKECLDSAIRDLQSWQTIFDPSWYLIIRITSPLIENELATEASETTVISVANRLRRTLAVESPRKERVFLPENGISDFQMVDMLFSGARALQREGSTGLILDHAECLPGVDSMALTRDVRTLARRFQNTEPFEFGLLECFGVVKNQEKETGRIESFDFIFKIPSGLRNPRSLRDILCSGANHSLSDVLAIAKRLAISVSYVHTIGFVHGNIQPETILIFDDGTSPLAWLALVGFRSIRMADEKTLRRGDVAWERDLYCHPDRQDLLPESDYTMQQDIYSLGVCMLEIGLWRSFIRYDESGAPSLAQATWDFPDITTSNTKSLFVKIATDVLPQRMGNKFAAVVRNCLTCMDPDNRDFGDKEDFQDADGVLIGVKYIEKILLQLDAIAI